MPHRDRASTHLERGKVAYAHMQPAVRGQLKRRQSSHSPRLEDSLCNTTQVPVLDRKRDADLGTNRQVTCAQAVVTLETALVGPLG